MRADSVSLIVDLHIGCVVWSAWFGSCVWFIGQSRPDMAAGESQHPCYAANTDILLEPQQAVIQTLTLSGGARFVTWRLRRTFLGECQRGSRYFGEIRACRGYGPSHTFKKAMSTFACLVGHSTNTLNIDNCCATTQQFVYLIVYFAHHPFILLQTDGLLWYFRMDIFRFVFDLSSYVFTINVMSSNAFLNPFYDGEFGISG